MYAPSPVHVSHTHPPTPPPFMQRQDGARGTGRARCARCRRHAPIAQHHPVLPHGLRSGAGIISHLSQLSHLSHLSYSPDTWPSIRCVRASASHTFHTCNITHNVCISHLSIMYIFTIMYHHSYHSSHLTLVISSRSTRTRSTCARGTPCRGTSRRRSGSSSTRRSTRHLRVSRGGGCGPSPGVRIGVRRASAFGLIHTCDTWWWNMKTMVPYIISLRTSMYAMLCVMLYPPPHPNVRLYTFGPPIYLHPSLIHTLIHRHHPFRDPGDAGQ